VWEPGQTYPVGWNREYNIFATQKVIDIYLFREDNPSQAVKTWKNVDNDKGSLAFQVPKDFDKGSSSVGFFFVMLPAGASDFAITATRRGPLFTIKGTA
jgi:hypothetical protein